MVLDVNIYNDKKIQAFYDQAMKTLISFYEINWNQNTPNLLIIPDRETYNAIAGRKTEDWEIGSTFESHNNVYLLSPDVYSSQSCHEYSDESFQALITHELSHLFTYIFYKGFTPVWLLEGIAVYSAGQLDEYGRPKELSSFLTYFYNGGSRGYIESGTAVEILVNEFGKTKVLNFLKSLKEDLEEKEFNNYLEQFFGIKLEYNWFNQRISKI